jgi:hypothetical protein
MSYHRDITLKPRSRISGPSSTRSFFGSKGQGTAIFPGKRENSEWLRQGRHFNFLSEQRLHPNCVAHVFPDRIKIKSAIKQHVAKGTSRNLTH